MSKLKGTPPHVRSNNDEHPNDWLKAKLLHKYKMLESAYDIQTKNLALNHERVTKERALVEELQLSHAKLRAQVKALEEGKRSDDKYVRQLTGQVNNLRNTLSVLEQLNTAATDIIAMGERNG